MTIRNHLAAIAAVSLALLSLHAQAAELDSQEEPVLVHNAYPGLASSGLTYARLSDLPTGIILTTEGLTIGPQEIADEIARAPQEVQPQLRKNAFFLLENMTTRRVLLALAKAKTPPQEKRTAAPAESELIQTYLRQIAANTKVEDAEINQFYANNKDAIGGASLDQVRSQIRQYLVQQKQQQIVDEHVRTLGQRVSIEVSATWTGEQSVLAKDNPVDKARGSGRPSLVDFGSTGCVPCDMLAPILDAVRAKYTGRLNVLFVHTGQEQVLAARYGVKTIPMQFFYDENGNEVFRHVGFWPQEEIEKKLAEIGVE